MIEKIYAYSKEKKIIEKYAFLPSLTVTNLLRPRTNKLNFLINEKISDVILFFL